jgi:hypothetical protein
LLPGTKVQILTQRLWYLSFQAPGTLMKSKADENALFLRSLWHQGTQFTCFTSTKVQILTQQLFFFGIKDFLSCPMPAALSIWSSRRRTFCGIVTRRASTTRPCSSCTRTCVVSSTELNLSLSTHTNTHIHTHTPEHVWSVQPN